LLLVVELAEVILQVVVELVGLELELDLPLLLAILIQLQLVLVELQDIEPMGPMVLIHHSQTPQQLVAAVVLDMEALDLVLLADLVVVLVDITHPQVALEILVDMQQVRVMLEEMVLVLEMV
jgi:hypothetical protein